MKAGEETRKVRNTGQGQSTNLIQSGNDNQATINHYHSTPMNENDRIEELRLLREMTDVQNRLIYFYQQRQ